VLGAPPMKPPTTVKGDCYGPFHDARSNTEYEEAMMEANDVF